MMLIRHTVRLMVLALCVIHPTLACAQLLPTHLRCEYAVNPLGIETAQPRFSWLLESANPKARGQHQTAYRIEVASSPTLLASGRADLWRSGTVVSDKQNGIPYSGRQLASRQRCWWRLRVWDKRGRVSGWSGPAWWEMGLLKPEDWRAKWIGNSHGNQPLVLPFTGNSWVWLPDVDAARSAPVGQAAFRREFELPADRISSAILYLAVDNSCSVFVNGKPVGSAAGWQTTTALNIATHLRRGRNVLAILVENTGEAPNPAGLIGSLDIRFENNQRVLLRIGQDWSVSDKPEPGWQQPGFDDMSWRSAHTILEVGPGPWGTPAQPKGPEPAAPYLRHGFISSKQVKRARAYVCGLGYYELYLNGRKVGDRVMEPAQTDYEQRAFYTTYEVTTYLRSGFNAVGLLLGNGWYHQERVWGGMSYGLPRAICQLEIGYADGTRQTVCSDGGWRATPGPVTENNIYAGETYDARREVEDWCAPVCDDRGWNSAEVMTSPTRRLMSSTLPPVHRIQALRPISIRQFAAGACIVDFGQNFAGWVRLKVRGRTGAEIRMRFAEAVDAKGDLETASTGVFATGVEQTDRYICRGGEDEVWEPRFTYHGFRYVEVTGFPGEPKPENLTGIVVHTDVEPVGTFTCSDPMLNRIHQAALWTERSNLHGHPTDCPARERCGWLGDAQITAEMTCYNWDMARFWPKYVGDILTSWRGERPGDVAPGKRGNEPNGHVDWGLAVVFIPWYQYLYFGDERHLREMYPYMARFVRSVAKTAKEGIVENGYGDWCPPGSVEPVETPPALTTTAWFYHAARVMAQTAEVVGSTQDEHDFSDLANLTYTAFVRRFFDRKTGSYGSQTANAMAIALRLDPFQDKGRVVWALHNDIMERHGGHHATGIFGLRFLFDALCSNYQSKDAWTILHQTTYPGFGELFGRGATTLWECWGEAELDKKWGARSLNHPMQGGFDAWFYQGLGGIRPHTGEPGFRAFLLEPQFLEELSWVNAEYRSVRGLIISRWRRVGDRIDWEVRVPPNSRAFLWARYGKWRNDDVTEDGRPLRSVPGVSFEEAPDRETAVILGSGTYHLRLQRRPTP
jgi:alpha-L-rhamnosidase